MSITEWLDEATPERREVKVCFDRRLLSQLDSAERDLTAIEADIDPLDDTEGNRVLGEGVNEPLTEAKARVAELTAQVRDKTRTLAFEGVGWGKWRELIAANPPAEDQDGIFKRAVQLAYLPHALINIGFNAETFVPAAIVASCVEPGLSLDDAKKLLDQSPPGVLDRIWAAVLEVNTAGNKDPFS
jgi:hypothetical protein